MMKKTIAILLSYTDADLNYNDNNSRTTIEINDPDARPAISGSSSIGSSASNLEQLISGATWLSP